jgi:hypothetical protein
MQGSKVIVSVPGSNPFTFEQYSSIPLENGGINGEMIASSFFYGQTVDGLVSTNMVTYGKDEKKMISIIDEKDAKIYRIAPDADGDMIVTVTGSNDFPPEIHPVDEEEADNMERNGSPKNRLGRGRNLQDDGSILDVMVVWTKKSECVQSGLPKGCTLTGDTEDNIRALIDLAVLETNTAYAASGVQTSLRLVHAYRHASYDEDSGSFSDALYRVRSSTDNIMDDVHGKRTTHGADMVALIIDHSAYCGIAFLGPSIGNMFSVTARACATGYFSFGHEIGHNLGCNHDKGTSNACTSSNYQYGWRDPQANFRSIMAYNCVNGQCDNNAGGGCTRVQRFSNDEFSYNGSPIGNAENDNARRINDVKATVAAYYSSTYGQPTISPAPTTSPTTSPTAAPTGVCCPSGQFKFKLEILTDNYGGETSWELTQDSTGSTEGSVPSNTYSSGTLYQQPFCLENGCYTFTIEDSWGDGICCGYGEGYFKGFVYENEVFDGGDFDDSDTRNFCAIDQCTGTTPAPTVPPTPSPTLSPTPAPTSLPTPAPTVPPTPSPTSSPTPLPTPAPTVSPTPSPTPLPTLPPIAQPTASPTSTPTASPSASPTSPPTDTPSVSPTSPSTGSPTSTPTAPSSNTTPTVSPTVDPWLIYNTGAYHDSGFIHVSHDINSGPQGAGVDMYKSDCVTPLAANEAVALSAGPIVNLSNNITYSLFVDQSKFGTSQIVTYDDSTNSTGSIVFCTKLKTETSSGMEVAVKKLKFDVSFDMTNVAFTIGNVGIANDAPEEVNLDMVFSVTACECDETFTCVSNTYAQGSTAPELRVCITPGPSLSIQNFELELSNGAFTHESVSFGTIGPEFDGLTYVVDSGASQIMVVTRIIEGLYQNGATSLSVSGACLLGPDSGKDKDTEPEFRTYDLKIKIEGIEDPEEVGPERGGCLQQLLQMFF